MRNLFQVEVLRLDPCNQQLIFRSQTPVRGPWGRKWKSVEFVGTLQPALSLVLREEARGQQYLTDITHRCFSTKEEQNIIREIEVIFAPFSLSFWPNPWSSQLWITERHVPSALLILLVCAVRHSQWPFTGTPRYLRHPRITLIIFYLTLSIVSLMWERCQISGVLLHSSSYKATRAAIQPFPQGCEFDFHVSISGES